MCIKLRRNRPRATVLCTATSADSKPVAFQRGRYTSTFGEPQEMEGHFRRQFGQSRSGMLRPVVNVPSAPLGYLLRMVGLRFIDLFSLDGVRAWL